MSFSLRYKSVSIFAVLPADTRSFTYFIPFTFLWTCYFLTSWDIAFLHYDCFIKFTPTYTIFSVFSNFLRWRSVGKKICFSLPEYVFILPSILGIFSLGVDILLVVIFSWNIEDITPLCFGFHCCFWEISCWSNWCFLPASLFFPFWLLLRFSVCLCIMHSHCDVSGYVFLFVLFEILSAS